MPRQIIVPRIHRQALTTPLELPGTAAWYDLSKLTSLIYDGSNRLQLVADVSGNSAVNGLCLNGVAGNYAGAPNLATYHAATDKDIRIFFCGSLNQTCVLVGHNHEGGNQQSWRFSVTSGSGLSGTLNFIWSSNGSSTSSASASVTLTGSLSVPTWYRVTVDIDNGAGGADVIFWQSVDGAIWTQVGTTQTTATISFFASNALLTVGANAAGVNQVSSGIVYYSDVRNNIINDGTGIIFRSDFRLPAKLATSFTESSANAATVTINTSGDTGARICGARDRLQMTQAKQQIATLGAGGNYATLDGSNDYDKTAPFSLAQPYTRYTVAKHITWTSGDILWDGNAAGSAKLTQTGLTPNLQLNAGAAGSQLNTFVLDAWAVFVEVVNGASSGFGRNLGALVTADAGATAANGDTMGADGAGANNANLAWKERLIRTGADSAATQSRIVRYLLQKHAVAQP